MIFDAAFGTAGGAFPIAGAGERMLARVADDDCLVDDDNAVTYAHAVEAKPLLGSAARDGGDRSAVLLVKLAKCEGVRGPVGGDRFLNGDPELKRVLC